MKTAIGVISFLACLCGLWSAAIAQTGISDPTDECLSCHATFNPGIVKGWRKSRHALVSPAEAMAVKGLARKVSSETVPGPLKDTVVGCAECHTLRPEAHKDTFDHNGYDVHVVVSPNDCAVCHREEAAQFERNLMSHAHGNLVNNPVYGLLQSAVNDSPIFEDGKVSLEPANKATGEESCLYCHGTRLEVTGTEIRETDMDEMKFPVISGWPNQGVGRINLDGSRGSCSACHARHEYAIEMARKPYTCKECHVGPDVPAFKVYTASKHGNIFSTRQRDWDLKKVPWTVGEDFNAPTCAACHISLLVNTEGEVVVKRSHEVQNRLPWRLFGLIYAHPHPKDADTTVIRNKDGLSLPTDFAGGFASKYLVNQKEQMERRQTMQAGCLSCHDPSWVNGYWARFLNSIKETNRATLTATQVMTEIWKEGLASGHLDGSNPFDEFSEKIWSDVWLFYANSVRFTSAMGCGGDYGVFANGRYHLARGVCELEDWLDMRRGSGDTSMESRSLQD